MADFIMPETQQPIIDYLLSLPFKVPCRTLEIYRARVKMHVLLCATPINDRAHQNDATSLTMYTTHTHDKYKYIYI